MHSSQFSCVSILYIHTGSFLSNLCLHFYLKNNNIELRGFDALTLLLTLPVTLLTLHISFQWTSFTHVYKMGLNCTSVIEFLYTPNHPLVNIYLAN
jgi:hypothetical protein